jgi:hypothetical protein
MRIRKYQPAADAHPVCLSLEVLMNQQSHLAYSVKRSLFHQLKWSDVEMETHVFKMAAKLRDQRTLMNADPQVPALSRCLFRMSEP